jgi:phage major head subunit gpT-like protein
MSVNLLTSRAVIGSFYAALDEANTSWVNQLSFKVNSDQASESYAWLGMAPAMREFLGGRKAVDLREFSYSLANKEHEATLEVTLQELRRDKSGQLLIRIGELADRAMSYPAKLLSTLIYNGDASVCYDSQYFFDSDHSEGDSGTQSNTVTYAAATGTTPTADEMRGAIMQSVKTILGFKDDRGEPMNENARTFVVMVPMIYWPQAVEALNLPTVSTGGANLLQNLAGFNISVLPNIRMDIAGWTTKMATFRTDGRVKPFILQEEVPLSISAVAEGSELEFNERKHRYGVDWAGNVGYGYWQHACLTTFT